MPGLKTIALAFMNKFRCFFQSTFEPDTEMGLSRVHVAASNCTAGVITNMAGGNFFAGLLLLLNADDMMMGTITMIGFIGNTLQILSPLLLERFEQRKKLLITGKIIIYILNIAVISLISVSDIHYQVRLTAIVIVLLIVNVFNGILSPGLSVWHIKSIPDSQRVSYFSFFSVANGIIQYAVVLGASGLVDALKKAGNEMLGLQLLRIFALLLSAADIYFMLRIKEYPNIKGQTSASLKQILISPFKQKKYLITVLISCLWFFSANIPGPYYTVYLLKDLRVQYSYINLINMLNIPLIILFTPLWSRRIRMTSWFKTLYFSMAIYLLNYCGLAFVTKENLYYLYPLTMIFAFIFAPGINLVFANAPYINLPEADQTNYIGFYSAMINLAAFAGTFFGRELIKNTEALSIDIFGLMMQNKQYILFITAIIMLISTFIINFLHQKTIN